MISQWIPLDLEFSNGLQLHEFSEGEILRVDAYICGITPPTIIVMAVLLIFAAVTAAVIDERSWCDDGHFEEFWENKYNWW